MKSEGGEPRLDALASLPAPGSALSLPSEAVTGVLVSRLAGLASILNQQQPDFY